MRTEAAIFKALSDPSRLAIFHRLTQGEAPVKKLTAGSKISQPAVSQHLSALKTAGLVAERKAGRYVYYRVRTEGLRPLVDWLAHHEAFWPDRMDRLQSLLKRMDP